MSKDFENNLILKINVSRSLAAILLFIHAGAMILVAIAPLMCLWRLSVWVLLGWSLYRALRQHVLHLSPEAVAEIEIDKDREISVRFAGSTSWHGCRLCASFVHPWLMLLSLRFDGGKWPVNVAVAADAVEPEAFRRWRVVLKLRTVTG